MNIKKKMAIIFESPIEALLQALHSSHALRGLRLWVSLQAAALSLWLRQLFYFAAAVPDAKPSTSDASPSICSSALSATDDASRSKLQPPRVLLPVRLPASSSVDATVTELTASFDVADKGGQYGTQRFTVYFHDDGFREEADALVEQEELVTAAVETREVFEVPHPSLFHFPVKIWGRSTSTGDLSWYKCQDLSVLNGSVVRFWDADTPGTTSRRCRR